MAKTELKVLSAIQLQKMLEGGRLQNARAGKIEIAYKGVTYQIALPATLAEVEMADEAPKKRGRKPKAEKDEAPKKRGRKPKAEKDEAPKKRGRKSDSGDVQVAVLAALKEAGEAVGMGVLKDATGLDPIQIRTALTELMDAGTVTKEGEKRGTVYSIGGKKAKKAKKIVEEDTSAEEEEAARPRKKKDKKNKKAKKDDAPRKKKPKIDLPWVDDEDSGDDFDVVDDD